MRLGKPADCGLCRVTDRERPQSFFSCGLAGSAGIALVVIARNVWKHGVRDVAPPLETTTYLVDSQVRLGLAEIAGCRFP